MVNTVLWARQNPAAAVMHIKRFGITTPEPVATTIEERLELVRRSAKMNQKDFCQEIGASLRSLQHYLHGERDMPLPLAQKIIVRFDLDAEWFLFGDQGRDQSN